MSPHTYDYKVYRGHYGVVYEIYRNGKLVCKHKSEFDMLSLFKILFFTPGTERSIGYCFENAHVLAKKAIKNMSTYECEIPV